MARGGVFFKEKDTQVDLLPSLIWPVFAKKEREVFVRDLNEVIVGIRPGIGSYASVELPTETDDYVVFGVNYLEAYARALEVAVPRGIPQPAGAIGVDGFKDSLARAKAVCPYEAHKILLLGARPALLDATRAFGEELMDRVIQGARIKQIKPERAALGRIAQRHEERWQSGAPPKLETVIAAFHREYPNSAKADLTKKAG
jgi:hypothetical protein